MKWKYLKNTRKFNLGNLLHVKNSQSNPLSGIGDNWIRKHKKWTSAYRILVTCTKFQCDKINSAQINSKTHTNVILTYAHTHIFLQTTKAYQQVVRLLGYIYSGAIYPETKCPRSHFCVDILTGKGAARRPTVTI